MSVPTTCPCCKVRLTSALWQMNSQSWTVKGPWAQTLTNSQTTCHKCRVRLNSVASEHAPAKLTVWPKHKQILEEGRGYTLLRRRHHAGMLNGRKETVACWAFMPLKSEDFIGRMNSAILAENRFLARDQHSILILPHDGDTSFALEHTKLFDEVWVLDAEVTSGADGPHPSVRAELSIVQTLGSFRLRGVYHYWPAAFLIEKEYRRLASDEDMAKGWALFNRTQLPIKVG